MKMLLTFLLCLSTQVAQASDWTTWPTVGSATLRWGPFDIYFSVLRTPSGRYEEGGWPQALSINYQRSITQEELVNATQEQWQAMKISVSAAQQQRWLKQIATIWPAVTSGSQLTFVGDDTGGQFYYRAPSNPYIKPIGDRFDRTFRDAFLAIWLSPTTQYPDLRQQLIGGN
ncbi:Uncharacterised protein [Yersinia intermedia]|uniref:hypothetical protein n=1 Tax=Yersinia intermedia TaxID=631 RepID=UPI0005DAFEF8|nr:hypothetical protein [Yersinia intermedia]CND15143.1 Uncharacterised protein [Yersinia intermedia]CNH40912.1 Uncharacterised protein [Yersinia intermedia]